MIFQLLFVSLSLLTSFEFVSSSHFAFSNIYQFQPQGIIDGVLPVTNSISIGSSRPLSIDYEPAVSIGITSYGKLIATTQDGGIVLVIQSSIGDLLIPDHYDTERRVRRLFVQQHDIIIAILPHDHSVEVSRRDLLDCFYGISLRDFEAALIQFCARFLNTRLTVVAVQVVDTRKPSQLSMSYKTISFRRKDSNSHSARGSKKHANSRHKSHSESYHQKPTARNSQGGIVDNNHLFVNNHIEKRLLDRLDQIISGDPDVGHEGLARIGLVVNELERDLAIRKKHEEEERKRTRETEIKERNKREEEERKRKEKELAERKKREEEEEEEKRKKLERELDERRKREAEEEERRKRLERELVERKKREEEETKKREKELEERKKREEEERRSIEERNRTISSSSLGNTSHTPLFVPDNTEDRLEAAQNANQSQHTPLFVRDEYEEERHRSYWNNKVVVRKMSVNKK